MTKKSTILFNLALISSLGLGASCSQPQKSNNKVSTIMAAQLAQAGKGNEAAAMYSRIGEILLSQPEGVIHAQEMFQKALDLNSHDDKANIYSALISPLLKAKGFGPRFRKQVPELEAYEKKLADSGIKELIEFALVMPEGKKAAKNFEEMRLFLQNEYAKELDNSLAKLNNIKSEMFTIELNLASYQSSAAASSSCQLLEDGAFDSEFNEYALQDKRVKRTIDSYDIKAIKTILKTEKNALTMAYSIGLEGFEEASALLGKSLVKKTDQDVVNAIKAQPNLLKIQGTKDDLRQLFDHSEEVLNDLIDFSKLSKELCHNSERQTNVISEICVTEDASEKINEVLMFVVGPKSVIIGHDANGEEVTVEVNIRNLLDSKVASIQELLPSKFDSEGKAVDFKDLTFSGVVPNGDLIAKLKTVVK